MSADHSASESNSVPIDSVSAGPADRPAETRPGQESATGRFRDAVQSRQGDDEEAERMVWQGGFSSRAMLGNWLLAGMLTILLLVAVLVAGPDDLYYWAAWLAVSGLIWLWFACLLAYRKLTVKYQLTTQRFIHEAGLLKRVTERIEVIDIDDVSVEQRILERMAGVGTIKLISSDRSHPVLEMPGIENVKDVASVIDDLRRKERRRRGLHIEAI